MNMHVWIIVGLTMVTAGGIVHVFIYPYLSGDINAEKRQAALRPTAAKRGAERKADAASRRKQITETLKELELRGERKKQSWRRESLRRVSPGLETNISALRSSRRRSLAG
jgi:tight adherence protein B